MTKNTNKLPGGKGDKLDPSSVNQVELKMGIDVEMEHTNNPEKAKEIALDHLAEDPKYYTKLKLIHKAEQLMEILEKKQLDPKSGISFTHEHHDDVGLTHVRAHHPTHGVVGEALFEHHDDGKLEPEGVKVHPEHRRKGIATAMYAHVQKVTGKNVKPSYDQTPDGKAFWSGTKGDFKKSEEDMYVCELCEENEIEKSEVLCSNCHDEINKSFGVRDIEDIVKSLMSDNIFIGYHQAEQQARGIQLREKYEAIQKAMTARHRGRPKSAAPKTKKAVAPKAPKAPAPKPPKKGI